MNTVRLLGAFAVAVLAACSDSTKPSGPITLTFETDVFPIAGSSASDTVFGIAILDGVDTIQIPRDSFVNVPRGTHEIEWKLDIDYLPVTVTRDLNPNGRTMSIYASQAGSCRFYADDEIFCIGQNGANAVTHSGNRRLLCPANDFGEFCSWYPNVLPIGLVWPADASTNEYVGHGKLLIGAIMGTGANPAAAGDTLAMAFYTPGDYSPRARLRPRQGDSTRWESEAWTDARHVQIFPFDTSFLRPFDRAAANYGLSVRTTYFLSSTIKDALLVRFDIENISTHPDYRRVNPEEPAGGHTLTNIFLVPTIDPDIGGVRSVGGTVIDETIDDNATVFPAESLLVAYEQNFNTQTFTQAYQASPGLVGMRLVQGPPGTEARAIILDAADTLTWSTDPKEDATYRILAAGRAGADARCTVRGTVAFICSPETPSNILMGWSVGPIASLAPDQTTSITVAILLASPKPGSFLPGTAVAPQNNNLPTVNNTLFDIAEALRALSAQARTLDADGDGSPGLR
jgi:hypothetical protein